MGFPSGSDDKDFACNVGDPDLIPELGRSCGKGNGYPLQYSCLMCAQDCKTDWVERQWALTRQSLQVKYWPGYLPCNVCTPGGKTFIAASETCGPKLHAI